MLSARRAQARAGSGGPAVLVTAHLKQRLGSRAWEVFAVLVEYRDAAGETTITISGIARRASLPGHTVKRALARLRSAGLVVDAGLRHRLVVCHRCHARRDVHEHEVYVREVVGEFVSGPHGVLVRVPRAVETWALAAMTQGGRRPGAGRPPGAKDRAPRTRTRPPAPPEVPPMRSPRVPRQPPVLPLQSTIAPGGARLHPPAPPLRPTAPPAPVPGGAWDAVSGLTLTGTGAPAEHPARELVLLPLFPGTSVIAPAVVPEPPHLDPASAPAQRAAELLRAYKAVHLHATGKQWYRPPAVLVREQAVLEEGAAALLEEHARPLRWVQWSFGVWKNVAGKRTPPPLRWVFLASRVRERAEWYRQEWGTFRSGRVVLGKEQRALLADHARMTYAIRRGRSPGDAVREFFPGTAYDDRVLSARAEAAQLQRHLNASVLAGVIFD